MLLTSYEMLLKDKGTVMAFGTKWPPFQTVIVDEAHRMKTLNSSTRDVVTSMAYQWLLLLTGEPAANKLVRRQTIPRLAKK